MVVSFWASIIILASVAFLAPYVIERWKYKFFAPRPDFEFKFEPPYCHLTEMKRVKPSAGKTIEVHFPVYYFRFAVVNNGKLRADDCEAVLEKVWQQNSAGIFQEWKGFSPVNLKWSGVMDPQKGYLRTIHPGRRVFCDIGRIHHPKHEAESVYRRISKEEKRKNKFFFELPYRFFSQWDCLVPGSYQIEVSVYSKNAQKITRTFKISWSGDWKDTEERMFREIVIS